MTKIELNKLYGNTDFGVIYQKTGDGEKCLKISLIIKEEDEKDEVKTIFINKNNIYAMNNNVIIWNGDISGDKQKLTFFDNIDIPKNYKNEYNIMMEKTAFDIDERITQSKILYKKIANELL
jgi:hypothetical protein